MEFCSECGTMLMPDEDSDEDQLVCPDCGHTEKLDQEDEYKFGKENKKEKKSGVAVVEEDKKKRYEEPDYDLDQDAAAEMYGEEY